MVEFFIVILVFRVVISVIFSQKKVTEGQTGFPRISPNLHGNFKIPIYTQMLHVWYITVYLPTFHYISPKFMVNDHLGKYSSPMERLGYNWFFQTLWTISFPQNKYKINSFWNHHLAICGP